MKKYNLNDFNTHKINKTIKSIDVSFDVILNIIILFKLFEFNYKFY